MAEIFYEKVLRALNKHRVRYLIIGGTASNLHGVPRNTYDLDLMLDLSDKNLDKFIRAMKELDYMPRAPVRIEDFKYKEKRESWIKDKHAVAFMLHRKEPPYEEVDVFLDNPIKFHDAFKRRKTIRAEDLSLPLLSVDDLIKLKKMAGREQDLFDIKHLKIIKNERKKKRK